MSKKYFEILERDMLVCQLNMHVDRINELEKQNEELKLKLSKYKRTNEQAENLRKEIAKDLDIEI